MKLFFGEIFPEINIDTNEQHHILKVLRMKENDTISVTDGKGNLATGNIKFEGKKVKLIPTKIEENLPNLSTKLHIAIAPTKNIDRTEFFLEKAVEMGISEITFLKTDNSERKNIKIDKLQKQALSACKQSLRFHFPKINHLTLFSDFIQYAENGRTFVAHCNEKFERKDLKDISTTEKITILIGPEGDFSEKEIQQLVEQNIQAISLGKQRLRTETAGVFVAAWRYFQGI